MKTFIVLKTSKDDGGTQGSSQHIAEGESIVDAFLPFIVRVQNQPTFSFGTDC